LHTNARSVDIVKIMSAFQVQYAIKIRDGNMVLN